MSVDIPLTCQQNEKPGACSSIDLIIYPKEHDLGGFTVRRVLPSSKLRKIGPWVFFDHMGPATFPQGHGVDVRPHPHINLAAVTYLFEGEMLHRDSLGNEREICPGEINLMVAGKGIVHSERKREVIKASNNVLSGLQLWLALPEADEEIDPEFHHCDAPEIPSVTTHGVPARVLIGSAYNVTSPVKTFADTLYAEARLEPGQTLILPNTVDERAVYVAEGELKINDSLLIQHTMANINPEIDVTVQATKKSRIVIIGGESLSKRHVWWNFVSSRKERIEQAKRDWQSGVFPKVPGDEKEFIPLPTE